MNKKQFKRLRHAYRSLRARGDDEGWPLNDPKFKHLWMMEQFEPRGSWCTRKFWLVREQRYGNLQEAYNESRSYGDLLGFLRGELKRY